MKYKFIILFFLLNVSFSFSQIKLPGLWKGQIFTNGDTIKFEVTFKKEKKQYDGLMDVPEQNALDLPLKNITLQKDKVHFTFGNSIMVFDGVGAKDSINGNFQQSIYAGSFFLKKVGTLKQISQKSPYNEQEVSIANNDIVLGGTLSSPKGKGPFPAVILITGSGAQNRNETIFGFEIFKVIADYLTRNGIAVLRLDDRGIGKSTGDFTKSTTLDFASDIEKAFEFLKTKKIINPSKIGLLGHSEGGIIAPIVANKYTDVAFVVLMAGPAITGEEILLLQTKEIMIADNAPDSIINKAVYTNALLYNAVKTGKGWDKVDSILYLQVKSELDSMSLNKKSLIKDEAKYINLRIKNIEKQVLSDWFKFFLTYNPFPALVELKCPALLLYGEKDLQVPSVENAQSAKKAILNNPNAIIKLYPKANHLFQNANTGSVREYSKLEPKFTDGFLDDIFNFIKTNTNK
ncbi:MAG: alpha/beta fold hydrolase [Bacteroidota bacterium]